MDKTDKYIVFELDNRKVVETYNDRELVRGRIMGLEDSARPLSWMTREEVAKQGNALIWPPSYQKPDDTAFSDIERKAFEAQLSLLRRRNEELERQRDTALNACREVNTLLRDILSPPGDRRVTKRDGPDRRGS